MSLILAGMLPLLIIIFLIFFFSFVPIGLWISAIAAGVKVSLMSLVGMRLRRVPPVRI
ncbi:MAG: flotillin-like FloA family protein, partial [Limnochordia bacterium]